MLNDIWQSACATSKQLLKTSEDTQVKDLQHIKDLNEIQAEEIITSMAPTPPPSYKDS